ncbi:hypothetical protein Salat_1477500 [Sesamum alatum]|uniref:Uncharacterized protein n=1 Tax=Sesamum alatum TaxID=300844 RepID=A0AAE2CLZ5_9LAMI|nr:hypothetical protein Salat_1477500 [Sesamum alatum]
MSNNYYKGGSNSAMDEYLERITRMLRTPTVIPDYPHFPNVHQVLDNSSPYVEKHNHTMYNQKHRAPEVQNKVHFVEHKTATGVGGKHEVYEDITIDVETDGFTQDKQNGFGLCKWDTFKV